MKYLPAFVGAGLTALLMGLLILVVVDPKSYYDVVKVEQGNNTYFALRHHHFILPDDVSTIEYSKVNDAKEVAAHLNANDAPKKITTVP